VKSHTTAGFRKLLAALPHDVQRQARSAYRRFVDNPRHPSLRFKRIGGSERLVAVRISRDYRAVGVRGRSDEIVWFWAGHHQEYEELLKQGDR
jgi:hypothetical protein